MIKKVLSTIILIGFFLSIALAYAPLTRIRNFVNDKNNGIPITSSYMDSEFNQILTAANLTGIVQSTAPSSPTNGASWFDSTNNIWKTFRNNEWVNSNIVMGGTPYMASPQLGDLFVNWQSFNLNSGTNWVDLQAYNGHAWLKNVGTLTPTFTSVNTGTLISTGNVGIGTSTLQNEALGIFGGNVGIGTPNPGTALDVNGTIRGTTFLGVIVPTSNVLFQYQGQVDQQGANKGEVTNTSLNPSNNTSGNYRYLQMFGGSYVQIWTAKFTKIAGINTVTVWCRIWGRSSSSAQATLKVDIGGQNNNVVGTTGQLTPQWNSFTINVSSLTNGSTYDVTASMLDGAADNVYCSNIIGFAS